MNCEPVPARRGRPNKVKITAATQHRPTGMGSRKAVALPRKDCHLVPIVANLKHTRPIRLIR
jgi:hypothetical protein